GDLFVERAPFHINVASPGDAHASLDRRIGWRVQLEVAPYGYLCISAYGASLKAGAWEHIDYKRLGGISARQLQCRSKLHPFAFFSVEPDHPELQGDEKEIKMLRVLLDGSE